MPESKTEGDNPNPKPRTRGFFHAKKGAAMSKPRIGLGPWINESPSRFGVFNDNLDEDGRFDARRDMPWTVCRFDYLNKYFPTHAEAVAYADREARRA